MSAPEALERSASTTSTGQVAPLEDANGMKQVVWQDDHGMELTHVREFEPSEPSDSDTDERAGRDGGPNGACCVVQ